MRGKQAADPSLYPKPLEAGSRADISEEGSPLELRCLPCEMSPHPHARLEAALRVLKQQIKDHPTLPVSLSGSAHEDALTDAQAVRLPRKHCAFHGCLWRHDGESSWTGEKKLIQHVMESHAAELLAAANFLPKCHTLVERCVSVYNEALAEKCREGAPLATYSIDRRCLQNYVQAIGGDNIETPICFLCACTYTLSKTGKPDEQPISWTKALHRDRFFPVFRRVSQGPL